MLFKRAKSVLLGHLTLTVVLDVRLPIDKLIVARLQLAVALKHLIELLVQTFFIRLDSAYFLHCLRALVLFLIE